MYTGDHSTACVSLIRSRTHTGVPNLLPRAGTDVPRLAHVSGDSLGVRDARATDTQRAHQVLCRLLVDRHVDGVLGRGDQLVRPGVPEHDDLLVVLGAVQLLSRHHGAPVHAIVREHWYALRETLKSPCSPFGRY